MCQNFCTLNYYVTHISLIKAIKHDAIKQAVSMSYFVVNLIKLQSDICKPLRSHVHLFEGVLSPLETR